ncbi:MAG: insulinase family protein [Chloroflexota bacterium]|nr:insulinase family protein [Chloroflexota bacterium]
MWTWYRVGSRNEPPGRTGISHWVEHMQFKGTPTLAKGQIFRDVSRHGGVLNAMTSYDWTAYYETLPADKIDLAIAIESDRMMHSLYDPAETEAERTVILSERQGAENRPTYLLYEELLSTAFRHHPYGHPILGSEQDLKAITRTDLYDHYRRFYHPANAFVVMVGDFVADEMLARLDRAFGAIETAPIPNPDQAIEPDQVAERRVQLLRPAPTSYLHIAYHGPAATSPDVPAMLMADAILSGGKGLGFGGSGGLGRSSRLYKSLVSSGLARGAGSGFDLYHDPYLMTIAVTTLPDSEPERIESIVDREIELLRSVDVAEDELRRAQKQMKAQYTYSSEGVTNQAFRLGQMEIVDSYGRAESLLADIERVTAADIRHVASRYLDGANRTVGWLVPTEPGSGSTEPAHPDATLVLDEQRFDQWAVAGSRSSATPLNRQSFERTVLSNGMTLLGQVRPHSPSVDLRIRLDAGAVRDEDDKVGLASFTARALQRGTHSHTFESLNTLTDSLGASLGVDAGRDHTEIVMRCLAEDLPEVLKLAADVIRRPIFPTEEIEKVRRQILSGIREADNDTGSQAARVFRQLVFPPPHRYGRRIAGELDTVATISRTDLAAFHTREYGPRRTIVAAVGGIGSLNHVANLLETHFGDWDAPNEPAPDIRYPEPPRASAERRVAIPGKSQADIVLGLATIPRQDPTYYALDTANLILGRLGLMGRLGATVRDQDGMAYFATSQLQPGIEESIWLSRAGVDPKNIDRAIEGILAQLRLIRHEPVTIDELDDAKSFLIGVLPIALESNGGVAASLINLERFELGLDYLDRYPGIIGRLTRQDLLHAIATLLDPDVVAIGIAGPPAA